MDILCHILGMKHSPASVCVSWCGESHEVIYCSADTACAIVYDTHTDTQNQHIFSDGNIQCIALSDDGNTMVIAEVRMHRIIIIGKDPWLIESFVVFLDIEPGYPNAYLLSTKRHVWETAGYNRKN